MEFEITRAVTSRRLVQLTVTSVHEWTQQYPRANSVNIPRRSGHGLFMVCFKFDKLHSPSMFVVKAKIYGVLYKQYSSIAFMTHLVIGQCQKPPNFSAFHWSPHGSLVSIGQNFVTTRVVHLTKRTETSLITDSDQSEPNHQLLQLCTARTAWSLVEPGCAGRA